MKTEPRTKDIWVVTDLDGSNPDFYKYEQSVLLGRKQQKTTITYEVPVKSKPVTKRELADMIHEYSDSGVHADIVSLCERILEAGLAEDPIQARRQGVGEYSVKVCGTGKYITREMLAEAWRRLDYSYIFKQSKPLDELFRELGL